MEEFFRSLKEAFGRNHSGWRGFFFAALALGLWVLSWVVADRLSAVRLRWRRLASFAEGHALLAPDLDLVKRLGAVMGVPPLDVVTRLDMFERATLKALSVRSPPAFADEEDETDLAGRIHHLRHLIGFDRLPSYAPLLTTRELLAGTALKAEECTGQVSAVDEHSFTVEFNGAAGLSTGVTALLVLVHAREARYSLRCPVLAVRRSRADTPVAVVFGHDETPERCQHRNFARALVDGVIALRLLEQLPSSPSPSARAAALLDISAGGALITSRTPLPVGALFAASFSVGGQHFESLRAVVLAQEPDGKGYRAHLEFGPLPQPEQDRLVVAVEQASRLNASSSAASTK